ncbi:MAG TPA: polysaccharide biosynthesis protein, partial [Stellaceae bacterium]|nr:polysaccharide biosynthesis protein [Stellaceae bacterium]
MSTRDTISLAPTRAPLAEVKPGPSGRTAMESGRVDAAILADDLHAAMRQFDGCTVLVTGGTGSFGRRFIETLLRHSRARRLIVFSRDEY